MEQIKLVKKAKELFVSFESKGFIDKRDYIEYEHIVNQLLSYYDQAIEVEKEEVDVKQRTTISLVERTLDNLNLLGLGTIVLAIFSVYFIARSISKPVNQLKAATIEVANGNLDTVIEPKSKDEIGDLAISFSRMTKDLKKSRENLLLAKRYTNNILKSMNDALIVTSLEW